MFAVIGIATVAALSLIGLFVVVVALHDVYYDYFN